METVDLDDLFTEPKPSATFKGMEFDNGLELLMNEKKINKPMSMDSSSSPLGNRVSYDQTNQGFTPRNDVFTPSANNTTKTISGGNWFGNLFGGNNSAQGSSSNGAFTESSNQDQGVQNVGQATVESLGTAKTWDGYSSKAGMDTSSGPIQLTSLSDRERKNKKRMMIKYLEKMNQEGKVQNMPSFNMDSSHFEDVEDEFIAVRDDEKREASIKFQGDCLKNLMYGIEKLNNIYTPFGVDLTGLSEGIEMSLDTFEPEFYEIHDMYLKNMPINPIVSLMFKICAATLFAGPAFTAFAKANPDLAGIIQTPQIKQMILQHGMQQGLQMFKSDYNTEMANLERRHAPPVVNRDPPPPAPIETRVQPPSYSNRPDIAEARRGPGQGAPSFHQSPLGEMFQDRRESGVDMNGYVSAQQAPNNSLNGIAPGKPPAFGKMNFTHEPVRQSSVPMYQYQQNPNTQAQAKPRPEMKGPSPDFDAFFSTMQPQQEPFHATQQPQQDASLELDDLISGLKPKIQDAFQPRQDIRDDESVFSNDSIRHLGNTRMPKSSTTKRRQRSDKNVVSLDL